MILSDISVTRPVFAAVLSLLLIAFGLLSFDRLPLREYPDIDPPIVTVDTTYSGAAANVVENRITIIDGTRARPVHLNPHIDYSRPFGPKEERDKTVEFSLTLPVTRSRLVTAKALAALVPPSKQMMTVANPATNQKYWCLLPPFM